MMQKLLIGGLLLASPLMAQRPVMVRVGSNRIKLTEKAFALRDATHSDAYVPMTAEMMAAGFWEYFKLMFDRYGYIKRGPEHKDRFIHEEQFYFCLADNYIMHNFVKGDLATEETDFPYFQKTSENNAPLKVHLYDQNKNQITADSGSILEDNVQFSISSTKCKGDSGLWIMKTIYDRMAPHISTDGVTIEPVLVEGDGSVTLSCDTCMALLEEEKAKNTDLIDEVDELKKQLADLQGQLETCETDLESCNENSSNSNCTEVEEELAQCKADKETCEDNLESCTSGNSDACNTCQDNLEQCQSDKSECNSELDACKNSSGEDSEECKKAKSDLEQCKADLDNANANNSECEANLSNCESDRDNCNTERDECNDNLSSCTNSQSTGGGSLEPTGVKEFDDMRLNGLDPKREGNWRLTYVDIITSPEVKNVVFARIPYFGISTNSGSRGQGHIECLKLGMVQATVRSDSEDELLFQWHSTYEHPEFIHPLWQNKPRASFTSVTCGYRNEYSGIYWYLHGSNHAGAGLWGAWGLENYEHEQPFHYKWKWPYIPMDKCWYRGDRLSTDDRGCPSNQQLKGKKIETVVYGKTGWNAVSFYNNRFDALCEYRLPDNVARDFKLDDTTDCFEFEDAAQENVRFFSCPWIKSDLAYITEKCESIGLSLASVRSDAELKALNNASKFEAGNLYPTNAEYSNYSWKWGNGDPVIIDDLTWSDNGARGNPGDKTTLRVGNGKIVPVAPGGDYSVLCEIRQDPNPVEMETNGKTILDFV